MPEVYRQAASIVVLRPNPTSEGFAYDILLLHKPRKRDAWQLPQGGVEQGETVSEAALRELKEEAGMDGVEVLRVCDTVYEYDFPASFRRFRPDNVRGQQIKFLVALASKDAVVQVDGNEIDDFMWVRKDQIRDHIKRGEYLDIIEGLLSEAETCLHSR